MITRRITWLFLLLTLLSTSFAALSAADKEQDNKSLRVAKIDVVIHKASPDMPTDEEVMRKRLKTQVNAPFSQVIFDEDLKSLAQNFYRVEPDIKYLHNEVFITLNLWPRPKINKITWEGNKNLATSKLEKELEVKAGDTFNREKFNKAFHELKKYCIKKGYFETELDYRVVPDPKANMVDVVITVDEGRSGHVGIISFKGLTKEEEDAVLDKMVTKEYKILLSWFTNEGTFSEETLEHDKFAITSYLQNKGYANAKVDIKISDSKECKNRVNIEIIADKGPLFNFFLVSFTGNTIFTNEQISKCLEIYDGCIYSPEKARATVQRIVSLYGEHGYIDANVNYKMELVPGMNMYNVHFSIEEGKQYRIGMIKVFGNTSTQTNVILHECLLVPGEIFNTKKLEKTEERIQNIGYFKEVEVYAVRSVDNTLGSNFRDVHIEVEEANTGNISFFFGFSTLSSIFGGIEITERNFNYKGLGEVFTKGLKAIRGGGEAARLRFNIGRKEQSYLLSWTKPHFMDSNWSVGFDFDKTINRIQSDDYEIYGWGGGLFADYDINDFLRFAWHYRLRDSHVKITGSTTQLLKEEAKNNGIVSASGVSLNYDSTNHPLFPTDGFRSSLKAEFAGLGGNFSFWSFGYINSYYYSPWKNGTFKYRLDLRYVIPVSRTTYHTLPLDERLYLGGDNTVRGFRPYVIGPKFSNEDPRGGLSSTLWSVEYQHKIIDQLDVFAFTDSGQVSEHKFHTGPFRTSCGCGMRLRLISNIPITIGMGFPVNAESDEDVKRFFFSFGGTF